MGICLVLKWLTNVWFSSSALELLSFASVFVELSNSEEIVQTPEDGLIALIDFQKSLGHLGLRLEKKLCLFDLILDTTLFQIALNCWRSLGSFKSLAFLNRLFLFRISWIMSLVSHGWFFLLGNSVQSRDVYMMLLCNSKKAELQLGWFPTSFFCVQGSMSKKIYQLHPPSPQSFANWILKLVS